MSFAIHTHNIPGIRCFAKAERVWDEAQPFAKSEPASWKPLDGKRQVHKRIVKLSDNRGYECVLHRTAVVSYFTDDSVALRCYDSQSTGAFAWRLSPTGCTPTSFRGRMFWEVQTDDGPRFYREGREALLLRPTAAGNWELVSPPSGEEEWRYDPKKGAAVRKQLKPYQVWHATMARLGVLPRRLGTYSPVGAVMRLLDDPTRVEDYIEFAESIGDPKDILPVAYAATGAHYKSPVPHDRLPRNFA